MGEEERKRIGARFKAARQALGMSQDKLAELAGITQKQVSRLEAGRVDAQFDTFSRVATALGKPLRHFMG